MTSTGLHHRAARGSKHRGAAGFTLIEIMLALAIMGFLTAILWGTFSRTANVKRRTEAAQDRVHAARVALMRITRELEMAYLSASENPGIPERRTQFMATSHRDVDELRFSWFGHQRLRADTAESDTAIVSYYSEPDPHDRSQLNLMRRETRRLEPKDPSAIPGEAYILCPGITRLKFSFYDYQKKEWREEWSTMGVDGVRFLPTHVRVVLGVLDEGGRELTYTSAARIQMTEQVDYRPERS
jgi:general secretion pathway protein J